MTTKTKPKHHEPCPCGSGLLYKDCCLTQDEITADDVADAISHVLEGQSIESLDELNALAHALLGADSRDPLDELYGLSSHQLFRFMYHPFDSDQIVTFCDSVTETAATPIMTLFTLLIEAIGDSGLKHTAKGNLPRQFCRDAALAFWGETGYKANTLYRSIQSETDFDQLYQCRQIAERAEYIHKHKHRFHLTDRCRAMLDRLGFDGFYPLLLQTYAQGLRWMSGRYKHLEMIQQSFAFSLYLLHRFGHQWRPIRFYIDAFSNAFPNLFEAEDDPSWPDFVRRQYAADTFVHLGDFFGLIEWKPLKKGRPFEDREFRRTPLMGRTVVFHFTPSLDA